MTVAFSGAAEWTSPACAHAEAPELTVAVPFLRDDPSGLFDALGDEIAASPAPHAVELVLYDDGSNDSALTEKLIGRVARAGFAARLFGDPVNRGRAATRNRLIQAARGRFILFLDADMLPDAPGFLERWRTLAARANPGVAFGGFSVERAPHSPHTSLHRALALRSDCPPAAERAAHPAKHVCTSNLLIRADIAQQTPFDEGFQGWGWEDVEWAGRAAQITDILHVDIAASHMGLSTTRALVARYAESGANFARFANAQPELAAQLASYRVAKMFARFPMLGALRRVFRAVAYDRLGFAPLRVRLLALKLWRAAHDGDALR